MPYIPELQIGQDIFQIKDAEARKMIDDLDTNMFAKNITILRSDLEQGGWTNNAKYVANNRIRSIKRYKVVAGSTVHYYDPTLETLITIYESETDVGPEIATSGYRSSSSGEQTWRIPVGGYMTITMRKSDDSEISVTNYDGAISFENGSWGDVFKENGYLSSSADNVSLCRQSGSWKVTSVDVQNWPHSTLGILLVFNNDVASYQVAVSTTGFTLVRYVSVSENPWTPISFSGVIDLPSDADINDYTAPGQYMIPTVGENMQHYPSEFGGRLINFSNIMNDIRIVQMIVDYKNNVFIRYHSATFTSWVRLATDSIEKIVHVNYDGSGDYSTVEDAVKAAMDEYIVEKNAGVRYTIIIGPGQYDLTNVAYMISRGEMESTGLFVPPNCTISGAGKDDTILTFIYTGTNDHIWSDVSAFNMPYNSAIKNLTIRVKNIRYCIHSAQGVSTEALSMANAKLQNVTILHENVRLEHLGFDEGTTPSYYSPGAYGSGNWSGNHKIFKSCDFYAAEYVPWFNHNRKNLDQPTVFEFEGCSFMTGTETSRLLRFIGWDSFPKNLVIIRNCSIPGYIDLTARVDSYGTEDGVIAYDVRSDGDLLVNETTVNDSHLLDNWFDIGCETLICDGNLTAYTPVSKNTLKSMHAYDPADPYHGILLHSVQSGKTARVKMSGHILISMLTSSTFAIGKKIGYSNGEWVEDNVNPILEVVYGGVAKII